MNVKLLTEIVERADKDFALALVPADTLKKFAELIVSKCIGQIALIGISNFENEDIGWTVDTAIANIKDHFGVEDV